MAAVDPTHRSSNHIEFEKLYKRYPRYLVSLSLSAAALRVAAIAVPALAGGFFATVGIDDSSKLKQCAITGGIIAGAVIGTASIITWDELGPSAYNSWLGKLSPEHRDHLMQELRAICPDLPVCSISYEIMTDPVVLSTNPHHYYERSEIVAWVSQQGRCPTTQNPVTLDDIYGSPNYFDALGDLCNQVILGHQRGQSEQFNHDEIHGLTLLKKHCKNLFDRYFHSEKRILLHTIENEDSENAAVQLQSLLQMKANSDRWIAGVPRES